MRVFCDNTSCTAVTHLEGAANETNRNAQLHRDGWTVDTDADTATCPRCAREATP